MILIGEVLVTVGYRHADCPTGYRFLPDWWRSTFIRLGLDEAVVDRIVEEDVQFSYIDEDNVRWPTCVFGIVGAYDRCDNSNFFSGS